LKRHQRTTKLHSQPGFACPQCEATFTRTDALRRHQKSRHNGVVIEPDKRVGIGEENAGGSPRSRSRSPGSKNKAHLPPAVASAPGTLPGYYRQQGINAEFVVFVPPRTPGVIVDPNYPVGHPTSAARLAQPPWGPPPQWGDGTHPVPPYPIPGPPHPAYYAPYYHGMPPLPLANAQLHPHSYAPPSSTLDNETGVHSDGEREASSPKRAQEREVSHPDDPRPHGSSAPVIDPSLESSEAYASGKSPVSLAITSAAVQAVFDETRRIEKRQTGNGADASESRETSPNTYPISKCATTKNVDSCVSPETSTGHPPSTMLTEDGETMLHPAELLTQESLASPPPVEDD